MALGPIGRPPEQAVNRGLGEVDRDEWPRLTRRQIETPPIDRLVPSSETHGRVLRYLLDRLDSSENEMKRFYDRWQVNEMSTTAFISLPDYEQRLKEMNKQHAPPEITSITIPFSYAIMNTMVTFMLQTFFGRKPHFQVAVHANEAAEPARMMELLLQYQSDRNRLLRIFHRWMWDGQIYGVGAVRCNWEIEKGLRTVRTKQPTVQFGMQSMGGGFRSRKEERTIYSGNMIESIDPYMFFPDPRVPMSEVNRKGEFVFWRVFEGRHKLMQMQAAGKLKWVDFAPDKQPVNEGGDVDRSRRNMRFSGSTSTFRQQESINRLAQNFYQVDQGSVEIVPAELGLGEGTVPEKWLFTILNRAQIIQAQPLNLDHNMHPVGVIEPLSLGWGLGHGGTADYVQDLQWSISWLINSHMWNVRAALNNMFVVDPSMIEMQDFKQTKPGKIIRMKPNAAGQDVQRALQQIQVGDVTRTHVQDLQVFFDLGQRLTGASDNLQGLQEAGGRKSATEVRTTTEAGVSRLTAMARLISAQGVVDLTEQMAINTQQFLDEEFYVQVVGMKGFETPFLVGPEHVAGDFYFPVHDGALPLDRVALLQVWQQLFQTLLGVPALAGQYDLLQLFEFIGEMGGARQLSSMRLNVAPDAQVAAQQVAGNLVAAGGPGGQQSIGGGGQSRPNLSVVA